MKTVFADFNAMTELEYVRLNCKGSQDDLQSAAARVGDWVWLSDGELVVGGNLPPTTATGWSGSPIGTLSRTWTKKGRTSSTASRPHLLRS